MRRQQGTATDLGQTPGQVCGAQIVGASPRAGDQIDDHRQPFPGDEEQEPVVGADGDGNAQHDQAAEAGE